MNENFTIEELEAYLQGELPERRKNALEDEIRSDPSLQDELEVLKISREAIEFAGWKALISKNQEEFLAERIEEKTKSTLTKPLSTGVWLGRIAASISLLLVGALAVLFFTNSPESITANHLEYNIPVLRSGENTSEEIDKAFQADDWDRVITISENFQEYDTKAYFLIGLAYLEKDNSPKAEAYFLQIESQNLQLSANEYGDQVDYYLVKSYLLQNKPDLAADRIEKVLADPDHTYHGNFSQWDLFKSKLLKFKK